MTALTERLERAFARGFKDSKIVADDDGDQYVRLRCDQCETCTIAGVACHEIGCPNTPRYCRECGNIDADGACCQITDDGTQEAISATTPENTTKYLDKTIVLETKQTDMPRYGRNVDGYGRKIPTSWLLRLGIDGRKRWHRVYCICYSNAGTCYVLIKGVFHVVRDEVLT